MGRKIDLSGLTDSEAEHVLQVVQRDMKLRKKEEERLSELKQELDEEGSRCLLLSRQSCFNQRCCIRCCSPFLFLLNPKRRCRDCHYNVCKACRVYSKRDKAWLCSACQKTRLLKTQSLEWFYTNVKKRFKRFGSAKVLKTLYRKHLVEHSTLSELTEGSGYEESIGNEGSVCGSDSTFYRQTEEHSMAEMLSVALRVAEEAIDEAITKAEVHTDSQDKQNEALYLREHKGELIDEVAKTIVEKIISRRKTLTDMRAEYVRDWPLEHNTDLRRLHQSASDEVSSALRQKPGLWVKQTRSQSLSLLDDDPPALVQDSQALQKGGPGSAMSTWKSVDRLDNSVLKSPDGNWIALQSAQLSRPSLLTKRKSLVFSVLEKESAVVSAYEGMGSDSEIKPEPEPDCPWGAALQDLRRKMADSNSNRQDGEDGTPTPPLGGSRDDLTSDSEGNWRQSKPLLALLKKKVPAEIRRPPSSRRTSIIDVNFNLEEEEEQEEEEGMPEELEAGRRQRSKEESAAPKLRYSAVSLRSITTEVLKVLNATEELLLQEVEGEGGGVDARVSSSSTSSSLPPNTDPKKLDQQFSRLEENVYVAAGAVYSLEAELSDLEECARGICSATSDMELSFLEEQVASAAAKVQQSELQIGDISTRIAALKSAGLNVNTQSRATKTIPVMPITLDSSRQMRRRLPAPPVKENKET